MTTLPRHATVAIYTRYSTCRLSNIPIEDQIHQSLGQMLKRGWKPVQIFRDVPAPTAVQHNPPQDYDDREGGE